MAPAATNHQTGPAGRVFGEGVMGNLVFFAASVLVLVAHLTHLPI